MDTKSLVNEVWSRNDLDDDARMDVLKELVKRAAAGDPDAWPSGQMAAREDMAGLYPDVADPQFAARLFAKKEFYEARAVATQVANGVIDPCSSAAATALFELTPVQRIVSRFMNPATPYLGMLLYHGVGVGKTCSAVSIAEQFLSTSPKAKVIVLVPQALKENFKRTVFDVGKLTWDTTAGAWTTQQCTGTSYLERLNLMNTPDLVTVDHKIKEDRNSRYVIKGYYAFANWVETTLKNSVPAGLTDPALRRAAEDEVLRRLFSDQLIIIDEAHNLRDVAAEEDGIGAADAVGKGEAGENDKGKALNPYLKRIVLNAEGLRLVFMSATPMYNSAQEILLLLNYLIMNDTKAEKHALRLTDFFTKEGALVADPQKRKVLASIARRYVSYMRGENPFTFPLRMRPAAATAQPADMWANIAPATKKPITFTPEATAAMNALPMVFTEPVPNSPPERLLRAGTSRATVTAEETVPTQLTDAMLDQRMQMANISYPNEMYGTGGWDFHFNSQILKGGEHRLRQFAPKSGVQLDDVFHGEALRVHGPKIHRIVESVTKAQGICFVYSRYIKAGALPLAVALERAGFQRRLADGRIVSLLTGVAPVAPICALCGATQHPEGDHPFRPACYALITSEEDITTSIGGTVQQATNIGADGVWGPQGSYIKVVIGSQVAAEGLDLKCIREMHVLDSWYHLNRIDQIVGRAIRYCSHTALRAVEKARSLEPMALNNCLIYLHAMRVGEEGGQDGGGLPAFESADMYAYRIAVNKALRIGEVQRLLKQHAWDCNLEIEGIIFAMDTDRFQLDAQGRTLDKYSLNDQDYTTYCDYQACKYQCAVSVARTEAEGLQLDTSTFGFSDARRAIMENQERVRALFRDQVVVGEGVIQEIFSNMPWEIASEALMELLDSRKFRLKGPDGMDGYLLKKAGYVVFQPAAVTDTEIPLALRYARAFQLRRQFMEPQLQVLGRAEALPQVSRKAATIAEEEEGESEGEDGKGKRAEEEEELSVGAVALGRWTAWRNFVTQNGDWPLEMANVHRIWLWILEHYGSLPDVRRIALQWWFDKMTTYEERRALTEAALTGQADPELEGLLGSDVYRTAKDAAYRIYNPDTMVVETFCRSAAGTYGPCDSKTAEAIGKVMDKTRPRTQISAQTAGTYLGFLMGKKKAVVFKTLSIANPNSVGAECGNTSNLGEHHPRIQAFHIALRSIPDIAPLVIPDDPATHEKAGADKRKLDMRPEHMLDITHQPLCIYMEFLARLLEERHVNGVRWFMGAVEAKLNGVGGKAKKA
jgi:hypothetical protein